MNNLCLKLGSKLVSYSQSKEEGQPIVFIHGNSSSKESFEYQLASSALQKYRLISIDLPGHGDSSKWLKPYSIEGFASLLADFCQLLELENPVLVGHSLGGHVAIETLPLLDSCAGLIFFGTPPIESDADIPNAFNPLEEMGFLFTPQLSDIQVRSLADVFTDNTDLKEKISVWVSKSDPEFRGSLGASIEHANFKERSILEKTKTPYLYMGSSRDRLINLEYIKRTIAEDHLAIINSNSHYPQYDEYETFNRYLEAFTSEALSQPYKAELALQEDSSASV